MFNPKKFQPVSATSDPIIAGKNSGVTVYCSSPALETYNNLVSLGNKGNHWARLIVKGIEGLSSSRLSMDNVYTEKGKIAYGRGLFYVALPGVTATFDALDDGSFKLSALNVDPNNPNYFQDQKNANNPGLWRVKYNDRSAIWTAQFVNDGRLLKKHKNRYVAISDPSFSRVNDAAGYVSASLQGINGTVKTLIENEGFDMHFTPGIQRSDGLVNSKQALNRATPAAMIKESAQLLAHTMYQARENENIQWFSDWGGSKVLTQSMQILVNQKVKLDKHTVLLNHPTSRPSKALDLGQALGLTPFEGGVTRKGIPTGKEIIGRFGFLDIPISSLQKLFRGKASPKQALASSTKSALSVTGATVSTLGVLAAVGVTTAAGPVVGAVGSAVFVTGMIIKAYKGRRKRN